MAKAIKKSASNKAAIDGQVAGMEAAALPAGFRVVRAVTLPAIVLKVQGESRCLKITEPMHLSAALGNKGASERAKPGDKEMEPATVCSVIDVATGEVGNFVVPAVVKGNLTEKYPDDSYVGLVFLITHNGKRAGKRYSDFTVLEVAEA